jgi:aerobic-type carbon monoxide dehydrogenase small subunit (CoxS/CutS family)
MKSDTATTVQLSVNGTVRHVTAAADTSLLTVLRHDLDLKGTRIGCTEGQCGACTVVVEGRAMQACSIPLWNVAGKAITTIEGLSGSSTLAHVQRAFLDEQAAQCGYCTNGIIMTVTALLSQSPPATRQHIIATLDERHLCRCGAQPRILRAIDRALAVNLAASGARP